MLARRSYAHPMVSKNWVVKLCTEMYGKFAITFTPLLEHTRPLEATVSGKVKNRIEIQQLFYRADYCVAMGFARSYHRTSAPGAFYLFHAPLCS